MIYLDNASTTRVTKEVYEAMQPYFCHEYGNPEQKYYQLADNAKNAIIRSRIQISRFISSQQDEVTFNSGATEGNNTVIKGVVNAFKSKGNHIISTVVEHSSVFETLKHLETQGIEVTYLKVNDRCEIDLEELKKSIKPTTILVSVMWVNNEVGAVFPIKEIAKICNDNNILFHTDATQAIGKININLEEIPGISFLTFSGHKFGGPKGIGVLYVRKDQHGIHTKITPLLHGGEQEFGLRAGTSNVPGIVGIGEACYQLSMKSDSNSILERLEHKTLSILKNKYPLLIEINNDINRVKGIINIRFKGINNQVLLKNISSIIGTSSGSACSNSKPSRTLLEMGYSLVHVNESIRISFSSDTDIKELDVLHDL